MEAHALGTPAARGEYARKAALVLDRIRSDKYADQVSEIWQDIERRQIKDAAADLGKTEDELRLTTGRQVIRYVLDAAYKFDRVALIRDDYSRDVETIDKLRKCADELGVFFSDTGVRGTTSMARDSTWKIASIPSLDFTDQGNVPGPSPLTFEDTGKVLTLLARIYSFFDNRLNWYRDIFDGQDFTRELKTEAGRRGVFTIAMSEAMIKVFGRPLDKTVASLTDIALDLEPGTTDLDQVKRARRGAAGRRGVRMAHAVKGTHSREKN